MMLNLTKKIIERKYKIFSISNGTIISFILIISTVSMPLGFIPRKANAQSITGFATGLAPAIASLPQCKEILNSGIKSLFSGIGNLFSSDGPNPLDDPNFQDIFPPDPTFNSPDFSKNLLPLEEFADSAANESDSIKVTDPEIIKSLLKQGKTLSKINIATESINAKSTCIDSIGRLIIKMLLQKLTVSTVAWVNSGFDGSPAFIQDPGKFFNDIAKNEILQFGLEINNPQLFPFGKAWMRNTAAAFNNKFQDNAQYSLNELIQNTNPEYSAVTFQQDFSQGGWNAWTALTQVPANNPLGFKLLADNEIQRRLAGTSQSNAEYVHDALVQANGFLGDQRCTNPKGVTRQQDEAALKKTPPEKLCQQWEYVTPGKLVSEAATTALNYPNNVYLNVTDLNDAVAAILDALLGQFSSNIMEKGFANVGEEGITGRLVYDTRNIYDPYKTKVQKDFIPSLIGSWLNANSDFNIRTDLTQALIDEQRTYSDKLKMQNKELLSTTDGKEYKIKIEVCPVGYTGTYPNCRGPIFGFQICPTGYTGTYPNCVGPIINNPGISNAYGLLPAIYQLDYCIPGPHPGWEEDSRRTLNAALRPILPQTKESLKDFKVGDIGNLVKSFAPAIGSAIGLSLVTGTGASAVIFGAALGSFAPILGTIVGAVIGLLIGFLGGLFGGDDFYNIRLFYSVVISSLTGVTPNYDLKRDTNSLNITSKSGITNVMNTILDRYIRIMKRTYFSSPEILPNVAKEAKANFNQLDGYAQIIKNNEDKISLLKTTINLLGEIKKKIDDLNTLYRPNDPLTSQEDIDKYESELKPQINAFGRISSGMVNGNDIAQADNLSKQIVDKKNYIYKNLIKGPYGCEAELASTTTPMPHFPSVTTGPLAMGEYNWNIYNANSVRRASYPFPIIYDYSNFAPGADIPNPEPWRSIDGNCNATNPPLICRTINKIPTDIEYNPPLGPGFLSFVYFGWHPTDEPFFAGPNRLRLNDLIPTGSENDGNQINRYVRLGLSPRNHKAQGVFETVIGIY